MYHRAAVQASHDFVERTFKCYHSVKKKICRRRGTQHVAKFTTVGIGDGSGSGGIGPVAAMVIGGLGLGALTSSRCSGTKPAHGLYCYANW